MVSEETVRQNCLELRCLGQYYRNSWADFDGRTLRNELNHIASNMENDKYDSRMRDMYAEEYGPWD